MPPVGFEPTISAGGRQQTYALDRAATGTGIIYLCFMELVMIYIYIITNTMKQSTSQENNSS